MRELSIFIDESGDFERRIKWDYSGEVEVLILQNNPGSNNPLNFTNYVAINVSKGIREGYIDSFQSFMEALIRSTRFRVESEDVARDLANGRIKIKDIRTSQTYM